MPRPPSNCDTSERPPSLSIDWELYAAMLQNSDMPLDQQKELIETLWSIAVAFVDLGFDLNPVSQICGESDLLIDEDLPDVVDWMNDNLGVDTGKQEGA